MDYQPRTVDSELDAVLAGLAAVAIDGPKGVGKTLTGLQRASTVWLLDGAAARDVAAADPEFEGVPAGTLLLDEWQRQPAVWDAVRRAVDAGAPPGRFLLTGSATPTDESGTHSGAGRITSMRMRPMALHERGLAVPTVSLGGLLRGDHPAISGRSPLRVGAYYEEIVASGLPGIRPLPTGLRRRSLDSYLQRVIDRDLPDQGLAIRRPETIRRWLAAYAAATSTTAAYSRILDSATAGDGSTPAKTTTIAYRDHLAQLWLLDPVWGWNHSRNPLRRLQEAPKHQLADPALAARLLGVTADSLAGGRGPDLNGPLFEALATLDVRVCAQAADARVGFLRTRNGDHEVDLVVEGPEGQVIGIEVKLSAAVGDADVRHLVWLRQQLPRDVVDLVVLTTGDTAYRRPDGVAVVPLALLGP